MREACCTYAEKLTGLFSEIVGRDMAALLRELQEREITLAQLHALGWIAEHPPQRSVTEIASGLGISHPAVVKLLNHLQEKDLVARAACPTDHRQSLASVTAAGITLLRAVRAERAERLRRVLERMAE